MRTWAPGRATLGRAWRICLLWLGAVALATACAHEPPPPPRTAQVRLPHTVTRFANGLQLLVAPDPASDLVHVAVRYRVGASADPPGKAGLAHLVEHLTFVARPRGSSVDSLLDRVALVHNAWTSHDSTHFLSYARADQVAALLLIEARRLSITCDDIREDLFARELAVVRNELRFRARDVDRVPEALLAAAYGEDHPYGRPVVGYDRELAAMTRADACAFLRDHYATDRAIVVVTGAVDPAQVERLVARVFARSPARARQALPAVPPIERGNRRVEVAADVDELTFFAAWPLPGEDDPDRGAAEIALQIIAGGVEKRGYDVSIEHHGGDAAPLGVLVVQPRDAGVNISAETAVFYAAGEARSQVDKAAFSRAVFRALISAVFTVDSLGARANAYASALQRGARDRLLLDDLARIERIDRGRVAPVARRILRADRMVAVLAHPDPARTADLGAIGFQGSVDDRGGGRVDPADARRPVASPMPASAFEDVRRFVLQNGLEVLVLRSSAVPTLTARVVFRTGTADDPSGGPIAVAAANALRPDLRLAGAPPSWISAYAAGARGWVDVGRDVTEIRVEGLATWSDAVIGWLGAWVAEGEYEPSALKATHDMLDRPSQRRARELNAAIAEVVWGKGSRNARVPGAELGELDDIIRVDRFRKQYFTAQRATLIVTGGFDVDIVTAQIRHSFARMPRREAEPSGSGEDDRPAQAPPTGGPTVRTIVSARAVDRPLVDVVFAVPVPRGTNPAAVRVLEALLDGGAEGIRNQLGAAYVAHAFFSDEPGGGTIGIAATVSVDRAADALRLIQGRIGALRAGSDELAASFVVARRRVVEALVINPRGARAAGAELAYAAAHGRAPADLSRMAEQVAALTVGDLQAVAASLLRPEAQAFVLRGEEAALRTAAGAVERGVHPR
ncbi:MAG TPA: insulinase family protein [Candidatus Acidoferrum sp.]|nr:insulinase family protein [Candidatus Acidoferrum sp.]